MSALRCSQSDRPVSWNRFNPHAYSVDGLHSFYTMCTIYSSLYIYIHIYISIYIYIYIYLCLSTYKYLSLARWGGLKQARERERLSHGCWEFISPLHLIFIVYLNFVFCLHVPWYRKQHEHPCGPQHMIDY